jgi:hypothetical protein
LGFDPSFLGHIAKPGKEITDYWKEVTWGDSTALAQFFAVYTPSNHLQLRGGLAYPTFAPDHLRIIRNASAHLSNTALADAAALQTHYQGLVFRHPTDLIFWRSRSSGEIAFLEWIADFRSMAQLMCE